jgi:adenylosuccinate synthase
VHPEDLITELEYAESFVGNLRGKVLLSEEAILCTDLERAEETLNKIKSGGNSNGGTGRGISPSYAHHYDRTGTQVYALMDEDWREKFSARYERYQAEFAAYGRELATELVPDFRKEKLSGIHTEPHTVGTQEEYLDRLEEARTKLLERDMVDHVTLLYPEIRKDLSKGVLFEGAQALGLHSWLGSYPDVTSSDTSLLGIAAGTGYWVPNNVHDTIGIFKGPYTSTVGKRLLPTDMGLSDRDNSLPENATPEQIRGKRIREDAGERGTTTGRWRKIASLDLPNLAYNATMSGVNALAATMMDICEESDTIPVCVSYTTPDRKEIPFQASMRYMEHIIPNYIKLPGWDGEACRNAKTIEELPENALKYLSFIQARTGFPIIAVTSGPSRDDLIKAPGY